MAEVAIVGMAIGSRVEVGDGEVNSAIDRGSAGAASAVDEKGRWKARR